MFGRYCNVEVNFFRNTESMFAATIYRGKPCIRQHLAYSRHDRAKCLSHKHSKLAVICPIHIAHHHFSGRAVKPARSSSARLAFSTPCSSSALPMI